MLSECAPLLLSLCPSSKPQCPLPPPCLGIPNPRLFLLVFIPFPRGFAFLSGPLSRPPSRASVPPLCFSVLHCSPPQAFFSHSLDLCPFIWVCPHHPCYLASLPVSFPPPLSPHSPTAFSLSALSLPGCPHPLVSIAPPPRSFHSSPPPVSVPLSLPAFLWDSVALSFSLCPCLWTSGHFFQAPPPPPHHPL